MRKRKAIRSDLHMSENELRKHVNRLRRECIPIGSSSNGYYFAETAAEVYDTIKNLRRIQAAQARRDRYPPTPP